MPPIDHAGSVSAKSSTRKLITDRNDRTLSPAALDAVMLTPASTSAVGGDGIDLHIAIDALPLGIRISTSGIRCTKNWRPNFREILKSAPARGRCAGRPIAERAVKRAIEITNRSARDDFFSEHATSDSETPITYVAHDRTESGPGRNVTGACNNAGQGKQGESQMTNEVDGAPNGQQYPLARDVNGIPLTLPPEAVSWRVRKLAKRAGRPKLIFDPETGQPLELPLETSYDDFCEHVGESGRYRLEAIDANGRPMPGYVAVTEVFGEEDDSEKPRVAQPSADALSAALHLIGQLVQSNADVMKAMASAFGQVQPAAPASITLEAPAQPVAKPNPLEAMLPQLFEFVMGKKPDASTTNGVAATSSDGEKVQE